MNDNAFVSSREKSSVSSRRRHKFYEVVSATPEGKVATYRQIDELAGNPGCARQVGYALAALPVKIQVPWQRVIDAKGAGKFAQREWCSRLASQHLKNRGY